MSENELNALDITGEVPPIVVENEPVEDPAPETPPEDETPPDEAPDPAALKAEIERLEQRKAKAKEDAAYWRKQKAQARGEYFRSQRPETPPPPAQNADTPPQPQQDDFDDYNDYVRAEAKWQADRRVDAKIQQWEKRETEKIQNEQYQQKMGTLQEKINQGFDRYDDFEEVALDQTVPITQTTLDILAESEDPAGVAYYLGKNRQEAAAISRMTPIAAARAIAKIETKLTAAAPPKKTITDAPPPVKPVGGGKSSGTKDPEKMTQAEYEAWRESQGAVRY